MKLVFRLTDLELEEILLKDPGWTLVAFDSWLSIPCAHFRPELEQFAQEVKSTLFCGLVDVDENPTITGKLGVDATPMVILFHQGREVRRLTGPYTAEALSERLRPLLKETDR